jgi:valyl-tRNA synthetase
MRRALSAMLRLLAPYLSFTCEEVWSWWQPGSVHRAPWPTTAEIPSMADHETAIRAAYGHLAGALESVRRAKAEVKLSVGSEVQAVAYAASAPEVEVLRLIEHDLRAAVRASALSLVVGEPSVSVTPKPAEA